jgi:hypothetical protein
MMAAPMNSGVGGGGFGGGNKTRAEERVESAAAWSGEGGAGDGGVGRRCCDVNQAAAEPIPAVKWRR